MSKTVADQLVEALVFAGAERVYGVVGDSLNPVVDAIRRAEGIEWVHVANEEAGAFAAAADAQVTGKLAVCAGSCGPGNTHLLQGLFDAQRSGAPVLAIASHITSTEVGTGFFQETHPERIFTECSEWCEVITSAAHMPRSARIAIQTALGAPGVSVMVLPGDVAGQKAEGAVGPTDFAASPSPVLPDPEQVDALAEAIEAADKITLFCGAGCKGAHEQVMTLAKTLGAPVAHALRGKEYIQANNPYDVGMCGLLGYGAAHKATFEADLLILLGTDFPYTNFLPQKNTAQVDRDPTRLGRRTPLEVAVVGDVGKTIEALLPKISSKTSRAFLDDMLKLHARTLEKVVEAYTHDVESMKPIHPEWVASHLDRIAADDAIFTVDTGMCNVWAARYLTPNGKRRVIGSFRHGSMANALPHAIGAQAAFPDRQVVAMCGDGGLSMLLGDLITLKRYELPAKLVVFNNGSLGMVKLEMMVDGLVDFGTDNGSVNYAAVAQALGISAIRVEDPAEVPRALEDGLSRKGPVLIDVVTDKNALSMPPAITAEQVAGFAKSASKSILGGGVGKMVELARTNLRNIPV